MLTEIDMEIKLPILAQVQNGIIEEVGFYDADNKWVDLGGYQKNCHIKDDRLIETLQKHFERLRK